MQGIVCEHHEGQHPEHHPLLSLGRMLCDREGVIGVAGAVDVGDRKLEFVDGCAKGHGPDCRRTARGHPAGSFKLPTFDDAVIAHHKDTLDESCLV